MHCIAYFLFMSKNYLIEMHVVAGVGTQRSPHAEMPDDGFQKWPTKTMSERRARRRSTGAISM